MPTFVLCRLPSNVDVVTTDEVCYHEGGQVIGKQGPPPSQTPQQIQDAIESLDTPSPDLVICQLGSTIYMSTNTSCANDGGEVLEPPPGN